MNIYELIDKGKYDILLCNIPRYKGNRVFQALRDIDAEKYTGYPEYIIVDDTGNARLASDDEAEDILDSI